jgi:hypothetical protein
MFTTVPAVDELKISFMKINLMVRFSGLPMYFRQLALASFQT